MESAQDLIDEFVGVAHGDFARMKALLAEHPALLNARASFDETALEAAAQMGRRDMAEFLLAAGAPMDICTAAMLGLKERVEEFLRADPGQLKARGSHGIPAMYYPVITGHQDIAELLLAHGAEVNAGEGGSPPLHGAVMFGQVEMAVWLLAHGANVNVLNYERKTPLQVALDRGNTALADLLRQRGGTEG
jgi:ankyrin repeat protein